jgi:hypothetical protein
MLAKVYNLKFSTVHDARHAATHIADELSGLIAEMNISGLTILLRREGTVQAIARFENQTDFQRMQANRPLVLAQIQRAFPCVVEDVAAITVYSYEREALTTV